MASTSSSSVSHLLRPFHHRTLLVPKSPSQFKHPQFQSPSNYPSSRVQATSDLVGVVDAVSEAITQLQDLGEAELFACPVCFEPLIRKGPAGFNVPAIYRSGFKCTKCNKSYSSKNIYLDLTVTADAKEYVEAQPSRTELFRRQNTKTDKLKMVQRIGT